MRYSVVAKKALVGMIVGLCLFSFGKAKAAEWAVAFESSLAVPIHRVAATSIPRDYYASLTPQNKKDIAFIVNSLSKNSLLTLMKQKGDLERAGNRINQVHPLKFLSVIFSDEELKVGVRNIKPRGWVWNDYFIKNLRDSMTEEANRSNMGDVLINDFATSLQINPESIRHLVQQRRWDEFVDTLIAIIPRKGNPGRYGQ